jgi:hypothetical protein
MKKNRGGMSRPLSIDIVFLIVLVKPKSRGTNYRSLGYHENALNRTLKGAMKFDLCGSEDVIGKMSQFTK